MKYGILNFLLISGLAASDQQVLCPVGEMPVDSTSFIEYKDQLVYFCCDDCIPSFKSDPEAYLKSESKAVKTIKHETSSAVFQVFGMDCPGCHGGVEKLLVKIDGIHSAEADYIKKEVKLVLDNSITLDVNKVKKAVEAANFTLGKRLE